MGSPMFRFAVIACLFLAAPAFAADPIPTASGVFKSQAITLEANGAIAFHGKPLQQEQLLSSIERALSRDAG